MNCTVPPAPDGVTDAVNVTDWPALCVEAGEAPMDTVVGQFDAQTMEYETAVEVDGS